MAITYGFYNSVNNDRKYNATQISQLFDGLIEDGVYLSIGDAFAVTQSISPGMTVRVGTGRAWFKHTWTYNDSILALNVDTADIVYPRIDTVVLEINRSDSIRANSIKIIKGTPAAVPAAPSLLHNDTVDQMPLADLYVGANVTQIINANITIRVGTEDFPFVAGVLSSFDVNTLLAQWDSYFTNIFLPSLTAYFNNTFISSKQADFDGKVVEWSSDFSDLISSKTTEFGVLATGWNSDFEAFIVNCQEQFDNWLATQTVKEVLTGDRVYYVRTDGNNSNTGLINTSDGAWLTAQYAIDFITRNLDLRNFNVTITLVKTGSGIYGPIQLAAYTSNGGYIRIVGTGAVGYNTTLTGGNSSIDIVKGVDAGHWCLEYLRFDVGLDGILAIGKTKIEAIQIDFLACGANSAHMHAVDGAIINVKTSDSISDDAGYHIYAEKGGQIVYDPGCNLVFKNIRSNSQSYIAFAIAFLMGIILIPNSTITITGVTITGIPYKVIGNATIYVNGAGNKYFPGNFNGEETYGGVYF